MSYCIGSLNLRGGKNAQNHQNRNFYEFIYNVITRENLVLFAFQEDAEARSNSVIDDLLGIGAGTTALRDRGWEGVHMPGSDSEFSFIWDSTRVQACGVPGLFSNTEMYRKPLCGDFAVELGNSPSFPYEFRLINLHLWYGSGSNSDKEKRMKECGWAKKEIYEEIHARIPMEDSRHVFTVALGDYNLNCPDSNGCEPKKIETFVTDKTTINETGEFCNSYDHFSYDTAHNVSVRCNAARVDVLRHWRNGMESYYRDVSNHVPVVIEVF